MLENIKGCILITMYKTIDDLKKDLSGIVEIGDTVSVMDLVKASEKITQLVHTAVFSDESVQPVARTIIRLLAVKNGVFPSSIHNFYRAIGRGEISGFTVPAVNIRVLTYDTARLIFQLMKKHNIGPVVFEIARSEIGYTQQRPDEYTIAVLSAAIKVGYTGPVFLQGDHYQFSAKKYKTNSDDERGKIESLIKESIEARFLNIDIDASTLVDLEKKELVEQQRENYENTASLTDFIRKLEPSGVTVSVGGEIGHIGGKNSTVSDFEAFMHGYTSLVRGEGISKVSVQTGTSHGGVPMADGKMAQVKLDFSVLEQIGKVAREKFHLGGAVQHGASTLPNELFGKFPEVGALEIHLATGFQNIVYDNLPAQIREEMYDYVRKNLSEEREEGWSDDQFIYKTRKKALGPFKKQLWELPKEDKQPILKNLSSQFTFLFQKLGVFETRSSIDKYVG